MAFDGLCVAALIKELNTQLKDGRINKIAQPENDELIITVKTQTGLLRLVLSANASLPLAYITTENKQAPLQAPGFCMLLRKHLQSGRIVNISQPSLERIIQIDIEHLNELGDLCSKSLFIELMGKHSNIIFCDSDLNIIDSIKHISGIVSSIREVLPGRKYFIPNTMEKLDPLKDISFDEFNELIFAKPMPVAKAIYTSFTGISPVIAQEICYRASVDGGLSCSGISDIDAQSIYNHFCYITRDIKNQAFTPELIYKQKQAGGAMEPVEFSSIHMTMYEHMPSKEYPSISQLLIEYYYMKDVVSRIRQRSYDLRQVVSTALERNVKKLEIQRKQLKDTEKKDKYRVYGELINAYGYGLAEGAKTLEALNYYTNETITIPLDPMYSASENSKRYFDKYQKLKRTEEAVSTLLESTKAEVEHLESIMTSLDIALKEEDLVQIRLELEASGYIKKHTTGKKGPKVKITSKPFHYISSDGYDIYVGKNNTQNDELTFKFANGGDWWFHAKKLPGSHVVLKTKGTDVEVPDRAFEEAARLAAYYSKGREQTLVEIDYLQRKNVKKPSGAKPGFVVYYTNYSMSIDSDISSLKLIE